jgi:hypothetical protein
MGQDEHDGPMNTKEDIEGSSRHHVALYGLLEENTNPMERWIGL